MGFFSRKRVAQPARPVQVYTPVTDGARQIPAALRHGSALQRHHGGPPGRGMWVVYEARTGILTALEHGDIATVMLVDEHGCNMLEVHAPAEKLRQAYFEEIPEKRRPDEAVARGMGYIGRPA